MLYSNNICICSFRTPIVNTSIEPENTVAELCRPKPKNPETSLENKENVDHSSSSTSSGIYI